MSGVRRHTARRGRGATPSVEPDPVVSAVAAEVVSDEQARLGVQAKARSLMMEQRGSYESLDITGSIENPTASANLVEFEVGFGQLAEITKIGVTFSNPLFAMSTAVGWRVTVNGNRVPNIRPNSGDLFYTSMGDISRPMEVEPFYVQTGDVVAIEIVPSTGFNERLTMIGRIGGRIVPLGSGGRL